jgi:nicotinamide-nucleotide amidase
MWQPKSGWLVPADVAGLLAELERRNLRLAVAESLTGGLLSATIVAVPGASKSYLGAIVAYQSALKHELLGVSTALIASQGVVNAEVAAQMAIGVRDRLSKATGFDSRQTIGVATTGVAGPESQDGQEVGTVFVAIAGFLGDIEDVRVAELRLSGDRNEIRANAAIEAFAQLSEYLAV